jgi:hypothetical protein
MLSNQIRHKGLENSVESRDLAPTLPRFGNYVTGL